MNSSQPSNPAKPWQSKLTPYAREIAAWRGERPPRTYAEVAALLAEKHGLSVHPDTVHSFVKVRSKGRQKYLKIAPHFLKGSGEESTSESQGKRRLVETRIVGKSDVRITPPKSYPVVNPNQL